MRDILEMYSTEFLRKPHTRENDQSDAGYPRGSWAEPPAASRTVEQSLRCVSTACSAARLAAVEPRLQTMGASSSASANTGVCDEDSSSAAKDASAPVVGYSSANVSSASRRRSARSVE